MRLKFSLLIIISLLFIILSINFGINIIVFKSESEILEINALLTELGYNPLTLDLYKSSELNTLLPRIEYFFWLNNTLQSKTRYQKEINDIVTKFDNTYNDYVTKVKVFNELDLKFLEIDLEKIDVKTKRNANTFWKELKESLREQIVNYNMKNEIPLRFELDTQQEVNKISLEKKLGMLIGISLESTKLNSEETALIKDLHVGSVVLFGSNIESEAQLKELTVSIQKLDPEYPVLISVDQEGGLVKRIWWDSALGQKEMANLSTDQRCAQWNQRSELLSELGINWNLGIVADVSPNMYSFIYPRTFSTDYNIAANLTAEAVKCSPLTLTTLKHYPGHGSTFVDTHTQLGIMAVQEEAEWLEKDAKPFLSAKDSDTIMIGHLIMEWLDSDNPASLSQSQIDYLRNNIGYEGLIVTDDIRMLEAGGFDLIDAFGRALVAGNDIVLSSIIDARRNLFVSKVRELLDSGVLSEEMLNLKVERILKAKSKIVKASGRFVEKNLLYQ